MQQRIAVITGATSGIGEATARLLSQNGFDLILCGRRQDRLNAIAKELSAKVRVTTLAFDVKDRVSVERAFRSLDATWRAIDVLINNAGNAHGLDPLQAGKYEDWDAMMDINVKGLLYVTREVLPVMVERKAGHVVNIGSIAGKEVYPGGNVYSASKAAVDSLTRGMRIDLNPYGIKVTAIHPGLVDTEFSLVRFKGDAKRAKDVYKGMKPLVADDIADAILYIVTRPEHVVVADMVIFPTAQASVAVVKREG